VTYSAADTGRIIDCGGLRVHCDCLGRTVLHADCTAGTEFIVNPWHGVFSLFFFSKMPDDFFLRQNVFDLPVCIRDEHFVFVGSFHLGRCLFRAIND
jgi:hypothetical protein